MSVYCGEINMGEQKESRFALLFAVFGFMLIIATGVDLFLLQLR
jgi:hypothetical protein